MKEHFQITNNYQTPSTRFGGLIYPSDFETERKSKNCGHGSSIAHRIAADWKFDEQCRRNIEARQKKSNREVTHNC